TATSGPVTVITTGGEEGGVIGQSIANALISIDQEAKQDNQSEQSQTAGDDPVTQSQAASQSNTSSQQANGNVTNALAATVSVTTNGDVDAAGDGVAGQSRANGGVSIVQKTTQGNGSAQSQIAGGGTFTQTQTAKQDNTSTQDANGNSVEATADTAS